MGMIFLKKVRIAVSTAVAAALICGCAIGAYFLEDLDEHVVPRPWNVNNLKRYYY